MNKSESGLLNNNKIVKGNFSYQELIPIRDLLDTRILKIGGCFLAGASLQTVQCPLDKIFDYDIFFTKERAIPHAKGVLNREGFEQDVSELFTPSRTSKMETYTKGNIRIQLIHAKIYESIEECLETFDFTCTMFAYDGIDGYFTSNAIRDTYRKELVINKVLNPLATWHRVDKYISKKGYTINKDNLSSILYAIENEEGESYFYEGDERMAELSIRRQLNINTIESYLLKE